MLYKNIIMLTVLGMRIQCLAMYDKKYAKLYGIRLIHMIYAEITDLVANGLTYL